MRNTPLLPALLLLGLAAPARADQVILQGGSRLNGVVLEEDEAAIRLLQPLGDEVFLAPKDVKEIRREADAPKGEEVLRYATGEKGRPQGLQVALVHLVHPDTGRRVDLVGAVHVADMGYYREVQRLLENVDVVLYEMVKPRDMLPDAGKDEEAEGVRAFQQTMAEWFGLAFQLDAISYGRPHFVHADLTLEEFTGQPGNAALVEKMKQMKPQLKVAEAMLKGGGAGDPTKSTLLQRMVKGIVGRMLGGMGSNMAALLGDDSADLIIRRRDEVAVKRLVEVPADTKTVAIFYGAAHLPDLEQRITALGYKRVGSRWLTAWDTRPPPER
jgi:hypothetical protein